MKFQSAGQVLISLLLAATMAGSIFVPDGSAIAQPATYQSTKCRNAGPTQQNLSSGSQVDGRLFTICAKVTTKQSRTSKKSKGSVSTTKLTKRQSQSINPTGQVLVSSILVNNHSQLVFRPTQPKASKSPRNKLPLGGSAKFWVKKQILFGYSWTQGRKLGVRFVPIKAALKFSDRVLTTGYSTRRIFELAGNYSMVAQVTYAPYYRWLTSGESVNRKGAKWVRDPGTISVNSNVLSVAVVDGLARRPASLPVLVTGRLAH